VSPITEPLVTFLISTPAIAEWAAAIASFVKSPFLRDHRLVGLGHSAGSSAMSVTLFPAHFAEPDLNIRVLATRAFPMRNQPFVAVFLLEPSMLTRELWMSHLVERETLMRRSTRATLRRPDMFDTWEEASNYYRKRKPWAGWNHEVFDIFTVSDFRIYEF
jgi:hypothetical protein